ncbi:hypothetical protein HMPREF1987_00007 [Peptostreptococcaceae bacterium oral taxon 113 str. W5053]|nr:hypothetical protein HMPREF1987_00007 [Peptostreptococcaceae bacterium oral taxon 113 str. W5053]
MKKNSTKDRQHTDKFMRKMLDNHYKEDCLHRGLGISPTS